MIIPPKSTRLEFQRLGKGQRDQFLTSPYITNQRSDCGAGRRRLHGAVIDEKAGSPRRRHDQPRDNLSENDDEHDVTDEEPEVAVNPQHLQYSYHDVKSLLDLQREALTSAVFARRSRRPNKASHGRRVKHSRNNSVSSEISSDGEFSEGQMRELLKTVSEDSLRRVGEFKAELIRHMVASPKTRKSRGGFAAVAQRLNEDNNHDDDDQDQDHRRPRSSYSTGRNRGAKKVKRRKKKRSKTASRVILGAADR